MITKIEEPKTKQLKNFIENCAWQMMTSATSEEREAALRRLAEVSIEKETGLKPAELIQDPLLARMWIIILAAQHGMAFGDNSDSDPETKSVLRELYIKQLGRSVWLQLKSLFPDLRQ